MTKDQLNQIRERCDKATPGPWRVGNNTITDRHHGEESVVDDIRVIVRREVYGGPADGQTYADIRFIAHTRQDVPALLDYVAELEAKIAGLESEVETLNREATCN
jgi:hypothetical protein